MKPRYLIIAGTNKAGTTSLFNYLSDHPDICGSSVKQTLFFIDYDYKGVLSKPQVHYDNEPGGYNKFFRHVKSEKYWLEASPDYIYSMTTPERIYDFSKTNSVELLFILRDPVDRYISWYYHARRANLIDISMSLKDFIEASNRSESTCLLAKNTLETGNYSNYIKQYLKYFPQENVNVIFFEEMILSPEAVMKKLCAKLDISNKYYSNYSFKKYNTASDTKNKYMHQIYRTVRNFILKISHEFPLFRKLIKYPQRLGASLYKAMNQKPSKKMRLDDTSVQSLVDYYQIEYKELARILEQEIPWPRYK